MMFGKVGPGGTGGENKMRALLLLKERRRAAANIDHKRFGRV